jgi:Fe2+-dicitrate sensor, membrane component
MNSLKNISEETKLLIIKYLTEFLDKEESLRLKRWLEEDNVHKEYFDKIKAWWTLAGKHNGEQEFDSESQWNLLKSRLGVEAKPAQIKSKSRLITFAGVAATWVLFFAIGTLWHTNKVKVPDLRPKITEIEAPLGAKSVIKLPDGTKVWLNAGSKISYNQDFDKKDRYILLVGEAYFHVATNKAKPFVVMTSGIMVKALGTSFNVKAYPEEKTITTTLEEGKIDVQVIQDAKGKGKIILTPKQKVVYYKKANDFKDNLDNESFIKKDQQTSINKIDSDLEISQNVNTELYTSWKDPRWIIESMPLATLSPMLERRFNLKIKFDNEELKNYNFTGTIEKETIEQILDAMRFTAPIDYDIQKDTILLMLNKHLKNQYSRLTKSKANKINY